MILHEKSAQLWQAHYSIRLSAWSENDLRSAILFVGLEEFPPAGQNKALVVGREWSGLA